MPLFPGSHLKRCSFTCFTIAILISCNDDQQAKENSAPKEIVSTPVINYAVTSVIPHNNQLFTEGLLLHNGNLYESTGSPENIPAARSLIGIIDTATGKMVEKIELDRSKYFGEGIAILNNKLYQLTYKTGIGFVYDLPGFRQTDTFTFTSKEGWGLTTDGNLLIMSDGTSTISFINPADFKVVKTLTVTENGTPLEKLNELECIKGYLYANIWTTPYIAKIDLQNGQVTGKLDLSSLTMEAKNKNPDADELNGIAYDAVTDKIFVTGKLWNHIYQVAFPH